MQHKKIIIKFLNLIIIKDDKMIIKMKAGINGLGRIGMCILRNYINNANNYDFMITEINIISKIDNYIPLIKHDSIHGNFDYDIIKIDDNMIVINNKYIKIHYQYNPEDIEWDVDIVLECTGKFNTYNKSSLHLKNTNVKKVIVSSPCEDCDITAIYGINHHLISKDFKIISAGSCTTNAATPILSIIKHKYNIKHGYISTIHSYTNDQNNVDHYHSDIRRARACNLSIIPTSTGLTKLLKDIYPDLNIMTSSVRVPVPNVSMIDIVLYVEQNTTIEELIILFENSNISVLGGTKEKLVSIDFTNNPNSVTIDYDECKINNNVIRILGWYDNEWGFSCRMLDLCQYIQKYVL